MKKKRIILHIDMDFFFAQIEERENPHFKGLPIVVGADPKNGKGRGVVSTANYVARKYNIKSGIPISRAYKLCPNAIFLPVNMSLYQKTSKNIFKIIKNFSKEMEKVSLDEAYLDLSSIIQSYKKSKKIGEEIKRKILEKEKLICTVGIGENKMMAKIACEIAKPNGIMLILPKESKGIIGKMNIEIIPGIGPKTKKKLEKILKKRNPKVNDALCLSKKELRKIFKKRGEDFYNKFRAIDDSLVEIKKKVKTIGKEHTFQEDTRDAKKIVNTFKNIISNSYLQIKKKKVKGIAVICRYEDFETHSRQISFNPDVYEEEFFYKKSIPILLRFLSESNKKIRLVGFRVRIY